MHLIFRNFQRCWSKTSPKLGDAPGPRARQPKKVDILGDSEEEEGGADAEEVAAPPDGDPVSVAVVKLTNIMSSLTKKKKPRSFEELLDDTSGILDQSSSSSTMGGCRKHATLLRNLRKAMRESPGDIYRVIESRMESDFGAPEIAPGSAKHAVAFRGWTEHRSKIPNLGATVRCLDDSRCSRQFASGKSGGGSGEAITFPLSTGPGGSGSWPMGACSGGGSRRPPSVLLFQSSCTSRSIGTPTYRTRLWPTQWAEAFMHRVKEQDEFIERRQKLGKRGAIGGGGFVKTEDGEGKGAGKKGKKKGQQGEGSPPPNQ